MRLDKVKRIRISQFLIEDNLTPFSIVYNSMSTQVKSNQFVYNLIELNLRKKYSRVIRICDYLQSQGIASHQLITIKSYALSQTKGYTQALQYLHPHSGLLINAAKMQYQQMLHMYSQAESLFDTITQPEGESVLEYLSANNQILCGTRYQGIDRVVKEESKHFRFIINKKQQEIISKINAVTSSYQQTKKLYQTGQMSKDSMIDNCNNFIKSYREIATAYHPKEKIKHLIDEYISYLANYIQAQL